MTQFNKDDFLSKITVKSRNLDLPDRKDASIKPKVRASDALRDLLNQASGSDSLPQSISTIEPNTPNSNQSNPSLDTDVSTSSVRSRASSSLKDLLNAFENQKAENTDLPSVDKHPTKNNSNLLSSDKSDDTITSTLTDNTQSTQNPLSEFEVASPDLHSELSALDQQIIELTEQAKKNIDDLDISQQVHDINLSKSLYLPKTLQIKAINQLKHTLQEQQELDPHITQDDNTLNTALNTAENPPRLTHIIDDELKITKVQRNTTLNHNDAVKDSLRQAKANLRAMFEMETPTTSTTSNIEPITDELAPQSTEQETTLITGSSLERFQQRTNRMQSILFDRQRNKLSDSDDS